MKSNQHLYDLEILKTAVETITALPTTLNYLFLGLLINPTTGAAVDPGITGLLQRCPRLEYLCIQVKTGSITVHLPQLSDVGMGICGTKHL